MTSFVSNLGQDSQTAPTAQDATAFLSRRRKLFFLISIPILLGSVILAYRLPPVYQSEAKVLIEQASIPEDIVASSITNYVEERIQAVSQRVLAANNVLDIIDEFDLYADQRAADMDQTVIRLFREDTYLENIAAEIFDARRGRMDGSTFAFVVGYRNSDPSMARDVTGKLVQLYLDENVKSRKERSAETTEFLAQQAGRIADDMSKIERDVANYKAEYANAMPERLQLNVQLLDRTERELGELDNRLRQLTSERNALQIGLQSINPQRTMMTSGGTTIMSAQERLEVLQLEYVRLTATYGEEHPDVVRTKREIESIVGGSVSQSAAEREQLLASLYTEKSQLLDRYSSDHPDVQSVQRSIDTLLSQRTAGSGQANSSNPGPTAPSNPEYIQQQLQIDALSESIVAARRDRSQLSSRRNELEENIAIAPTVEKDWLELNRGYESLRAEYDQIRERIAEAELSERLESQNKGERFLLLERASLPSEPIEPDRSAIMFLGVVLAIGIGIAVAALVDGLDSTVRSSRDLELTFAATPLVAVPFIETRLDRRKRLIQHAISLTALVVAVVTVLAWI